MNRITEVEKESEYDTLHSTKRINQINKYGDDHFSKAI
jgi:hypothetical protein